MNFPSQMFFNDINHGYRAAMLKKTSLWLLPFYMSVATYCYYEEVRKTMYAVIVSHLLKAMTLQRLLTLLWFSLCESCEHHHVSSNYCIIFSIIIQLLYYFFHVESKFYIVTLLLGFKCGFLMIFADLYLTLFTRFCFISDDG